jgi:calcineurin-like phosphoesterase family protein
MLMQKYSMAADDVMFTADQHFGHENIIRFCERPFKDADHMTEVMVERWNRAVRPDQTVFHLGDFGYRGGVNFVKRTLARLNGNVILIQGNHDHRRTLEFFTAVHDMAEVMVTAHGVDQRIIMCHYAMRVWNHSFRGSWHLYGHSHGTLPSRQDRKEMDIGVDCWNFSPVSFWEIESVMDIMGQEELDDLHLRAGYTEENIK